jgi:hypothetical protein
VSCSALAGVRRELSHDSSGRVSSCSITHRSPGLMVVLPLSSNAITYFRRGYTSARSAEIGSRNTSQ